MKRTSLQHAVRSTPYDAEPFKAPLTTASSKQRFSLRWSRITRWARRQSFSNLPGNHREMTS
jgi:hypothetical protein